MTDNKELEFILNVIARYDTNNCSLSYLIGYLESVIKYGLSDYSEWLRDELLSNWEKLSNQNELNKNISLVDDCLLKIKRAIFQYKYYGYTYTPWQKYKN